MKETPVKESPINETKDEDEADLDDLQVNEESVFKGGINKSVDINKSSGNFSTNTKSFGGIWTPINTTKSQEFVSRSRTGGAFGQSQNFKTFEDLKG